MILLSNETKPSVDGDTSRLIGGTIMQSVSLNSAVTSCMGRIITVGFQLTDDDSLLPKIVKPLLREQRDRFSRSFVNRVERSLFADFGCLSTTGQNQANHQTQPLH